MDLGVLEGQTRGDYFLNSIFDPSVNQCIEQLLSTLHEWNMIKVTFIHFGSPNESLKCCLDVFTVFPGKAFDLYISFQN